MKLLMLLLISSCASQNPFKLGTTQSFQTTRYETRIGLMCPLNYYLSSDGLCHYLKPVGRDIAVPSFKPAKKANKQVKQAVNCSIAVKQ